MQNYAPGRPIVLSFVLADELGNQLLPIAVRWRLIDEAEQALVDWTDLDLPEPNQDTLTITIEAAHTSLAAGVVRSIRTVELEVTTDTGTVPQSQTVLLAASTPLVIPATSWQTYGQAVLVAEQYHGLDGWLAASREDRERALIDARHRIAALPLRPCYDDDMSILRTGPGGSWPTMVRDMTLEQYGQLAPQMRRAMSHAQVLEASEILAADPVTQARDNGLMSMSVGESSQFFRPTKKLDLGVTKRAYALLCRYLDTGIRIGRT